MRMKIQEEGKTQILEGEKNFMDEEVVNNAICYKTLNSEKKTKCKMRVP